MKSSFVVVVAAVLALALSPSNASADQILLRVQRWVVTAPDRLDCSLAPVLKITGPENIFDEANREHLVAIQSGVTPVLIKQCPNLRDVILANGRARRVIRVSTDAANASVPAPAAAPPSATPTDTASAATATAAPVRISAPSAVEVPELSVRSTLPRLSSAKDDEDKCEVLLKWLESGRSETSRNAYNLPPEMRIVFRDEPMMAVFGMPYDQMEPRARLEQHQKTIIKCQGLARPRPLPIVGARRPNREMQEYSRQFSLYQPLLDQAFMGQPGPFEPAALTRYIVQVREQMAWANQAMSAAAGAPATQASFDRIASQRQASASQMNVLRESERAQVAAFLQRRQGEIAPAVADSWLNERRGTEQSVGAARTLQASRSAVTPVLAMMDATARTRWEQQYTALMDSLVSPAVRADVSAVGSVPATLTGAMQLAARKAQFDSTFGSFRGVPSVDVAREQYVQTRATLLTQLLPLWQQQTAALALEAPALAAKHQEFESLFPTQDDRSGALFTQYSVAIKAKEDQLRTLIAEQQRKEEEQRAKQTTPPAPQQPPIAQTAQARGGRPRGDASGPLSMNSFTASGLVNERALVDLFRGDFINVEFDRDDLVFGGIFQQYLESFGRQCRDYLPTNMVEMTTQECATERVTRNGFGVEVSRVCVDWVTVGTGIYADPVVYDAKKSVDRQKALDTGRQISQAMSQFAGPGAIGNAMQLVGTAQAVISDMQSLVQMNSCASPGLKRFEDNLRMFALNKAPIRLDGKPAISPALIPIPGIPYKDHDYTRLLSDLVVDDSSKWGGFARFISGSVTNASVSSRDAAGRPARVVAPYAHENLLGRQQGSVTLTFDEGMPQCLTYSETPAVCHAPNRKIVAAYLDGRYQ
jgi:hypothetical protein